MQFQTFSTAGLEPRHRLEFWNDYASDNGAPVVSDPADARSFTAGVIHTSIGELRVAEVRTDAQRARHSLAHVAKTREALFYLQIQLTGSCRVRQHGREALLRANDFALYDTGEPYELTFDQANSVLVVGVPAEAMRRYFGNPEDVVAVRMPGDAGMSGLVSDFLRVYWRELRRQMDVAMAPRALHAALDMAAGAYSIVSQRQVARSSLAAAHRLRIVNYIETHLGNPELTPTTIGQACGITPRYLHHLFAAEQETVARLILRRRLEECSKALLARAQRARSITAIAFDYGFNSATHFGRAFRERFGMTPREYRQGAVSTSVER